MEDLMFDMSSIKVWAIFQSNLMQEIKHLKYWSWQVHHEFLVYKRLTQPSLRNKFPNQDVTNAAVQW